MNKHTLGEILPEKLKLKGSEPSTQKKAVQCRTDLSRFFLSHGFKTHSSGYVAGSSAGLPRTPLPIQRKWTRFPSAGISVR